MKLSKLLDARCVLSSHAEDKVSGTLAYKIMKILKSSDSEEEFYCTRVKALIDEYAEKDDKGNPVVNDSKVKIKEDKISECEMAISQLRETEVIVPQIFLTASDLGELQLSAKEAFALESFIDN